jgi:thiol-disulfide isomerase/thioredoxin
MSLFSRQRSDRATSLPSEGRLPGFDGATGWLNSPPLSPDDLRGKVALVDFWTYTCINWLRTLGYVRAWAERYEQHGLVVVGVHTPEFPFERDEDNVRWAIANMDVKYPVALDPDYAVWQAFSNSYWPAVYIADAEGHIRYHHYGEGAYDECEGVIQELLRDAGRNEIPDDLVSPELFGFEVQADWENLDSPETYLGSEQGSNFARGIPADSLNVNQWTLVGDWAVERRASVLNGAKGSIVFRFHARDVNLVMGPPAKGSSVPFSVLVDGEPPGDAHGFDVDEQGRGTVEQQRLYQLVREPGRIADRVVEIAFDASGAGAYCFTFG